VAHYLIVLLVFRMNEEYIHLHDSSDIC